MLLDAMEYAGATPSPAQAIRLREHAENGTLGPHVMERVMNEEKPNQKEKISLRYEEARRYIPPNVPYHKTGEYILKALAFYKEHAERRTGERGSR